MDQQGPAPKKARRKHQERYSKIEGDVTKAGQEIQLLSRYSTAQRVALEKLVEKYQKYTGSSNLARRIDQDVFLISKICQGDLLDALLDQYTDVLTTLRTSYELAQTVKSRRSSLKSGKVEKSARSHDGASSRGSLAARELFSTCKNGSEVDIDTALASQPLGVRGGHATYWVHCQNFDQLHVLLQLKTRLVGRKKSRSPHYSSNVSVASRRASNKSLTFRDGNDDDRAGVIVCDELASFVKRRDSKTVREIEHLPGQKLEEAVASVRYASGSNAVVVVGGSPATSDRSSQGLVFTKRAKFRRKAVGDLFDLDKLDTSLKGARLERSDDSTSSESGVPSNVRTVREWLRSHQEVQPLVHIEYQRFRFIGHFNDDVQGLWATLDRDVFFATPSDTKLASSSPKAKSEAMFPHAILEVRWEGQDTPELVSLLDASHLAERVPGFSIETHAIAILCKPAGMPSPFWMDALEKDIRKVPTKVSKSPVRGKAVAAPGTQEKSASNTSASNASTDQPSSGVFSVAHVSSPQTSIPEELPVAIRKPVQSSKKPPKQRHHAPKDDRPRYWNEFDDGESYDGAHDPYTILIDPNEPSLLSSLCTAAASQLSKPLGLIKSWLGSAPKKRDETDTGAQHPLLQDYFSQRPDAAPEAADVELDGSSTTYDTFLTHSSARTTITPQHRSSMHKSRANLLLRLTLALFGSSLVLFVVAVVLKNGVVRRRRSGAAGPADVATSVGAALSMVTAGAGAAVWWTRGKVGAGMVVVALAFALSVVVNVVLIVFVMGLER